ncbi:MAG: hypothetical protein HQ548_04825 [Chloroflexi bacterium]|nr:hypothetical protein [Chloroflexota bacterium]
MSCQIFAPGVDPADAQRIPGMATPREGKMVPSDAPGFGVEVNREQLTSFNY